MLDAEIIERLRQRVPREHTVDIGLRTEAVITSWLLSRGIRVLPPCGFNHRYDLVLDLDGEFVRVQCKTGRLRRGAVHFNSESVRSNSKGALRRSYDGDAEIFLVHCSETDEIYAVPVAEAPKRGVSLRVDPTANSQEKGVRWAADYVLPA